MKVTIRESTVHGEAHAPPSKSYTHRAVLAAGYSDADEEIVVHHPLLSADTKETMAAVQAFGGDVLEIEGAIEVDGFAGEPEVPPDIIDCGNSGTTMRLTAGAASLVDGLTVLTGDVSLRDRPNGPLLDALRQLDVDVESREGGRAPLAIVGPTDGGEVEIPGDVSSQFVTSLLMAGACTEEGIDVELTTELKSAPYVEITEEVLDAFGVDVERTDDGFHVEGGQSYRPEGDEYSVPGDFSSASYLLAAGAVAGDEPVHVHELYPGAQGDAAIVDVLDRMGADVEWDEDAGVVTVEPSDLSGVEVDVGDTPDLLPTIAVLGAVADGTTHITNAEHVRYKETDRVAAMATELEKLGAEVEEHEDELVIHGGDSDLEGAAVDSYTDHRIVMSLSIAGLVAEGETVIHGGEHVEISFPGFFDVLYDLGADVHRESEEPEVPPKPTE
ncbi:3-phosphoshikimate 1-carboxyvinyltransferase [Halospeciosus flavus]|uniref:3-phosphoshikimate 1-carboxyvinyltransferase n=1 Tax=Halospeciosus flavus TaxID=3032283 RepID=A0ABD5Z2B3_9EURY|nr:3-phosphoshikimate 1-carboxyvinyltransferase [Halospeciosus flavus]